MSLRNRLARVGACLTLLLTLGVFAAASAAPALAESGPCTDEVSANYFQGMVEDWSVQWVRGVRASIDPRELTFRPCSNGTAPGPLTHDGVTAWIGLEPGASSSNSGIAQVGIVRCNQVGFAWCDTNDPNGATLHFYLQRQGCGYGPVVTDFGAINYEEHEYQLYVYNGTAYVKLDGVVWFSWNVSTSERTQCWLTSGHDTRAEWAAETWDGGDGVASTDDKLNFRGAKSLWDDQIGWYGNFDGWSPCDRNADSDVLNYSCDVISDYDFTVWSTRW